MHFEVRFFGYWWSTFTPPRCCASSRYGGDVIGWQSHMAGAISMARRTGRFAFAALFWQGASRSNAMVEDQRAIGTPFVG